VAILPDSTKTLGLSTGAFCPLRRFGRSSSHALKVVVVKLAACCVYNVKT
jgi:hypothetical protein